MVEGIKAFGNMADKFNWSLEKESTDAMVNSYKDGLVSRRDYLVDLDSKGNNTINELFLVVQKSLSLITDLLQLYISNCLFGTTFVA